MNRHKRVLFRSVLGEMGKELETDGFERVEETIFEVPLSTQAVAVVHFAEVDYPDDPAIYINPTLGVAYEPIEHLLSKLTERKPSKRATSTVATSLGYVTAEKRYIAYEFSTNPATSWRPNDLAQIILRDGMLWARQNSNLEIILADLVAFRFSGRDSSRFRVPLAYYLMDRIEDARFWVLKGSAEVGLREDGYSQTYRRFAESLLELLSRATTSKGL